MKHARSDYQERIIDTAGLIPDDEPVLFIRGQDVCAIPAAEAWCEAAETEGVDDDVIYAVRVQVEAIRDWQRDHAVKVPDVPAGVL